MRTVRDLWRVSTRVGAVYLVPLAIALQIPTVWEQRRALGHDWTSTLEVANGSAVLLAILGIVASSLIASRWSDTEELLGPITRQFWWRFLVPGGLVAATLVLVHLLWVLGVVVADVRNGLSGTANPGVLVPVVLAITGCSLVGAVIGGRVKSWYAAPALGVLLYVGLINGGPVVGTMLQLGGIGMRLSALVVRPELVVAQSVMWGAVSLAAVLFAASTVRPRGVRVGLLVIAMTVVAVPASAVSSVPRERFELADSLEWTCQGAAPSLCALSGDAPGDLVDLQQRYAEAHRRWSRSSSSGAVETYWQRLDVPVPGHRHEVRVARAMSDAEIVQEVITADLPCVDRWTYEQFLVMEEVSRRLVGAGLDRPQQSADAAIPDLTC